MAEVMVIVVIMGNCLEGWEEECWERLCSPCSWAVNYFFNVGDQMK